MRTTVSDILLFQKCPYAWYIRNINKREPVQKATPLLHGTEVHKEFQDLLNNLKDHKLNTVAIAEGTALPANPHTHPHLARLEIADYKALRLELAKYEILKVETPLTVNVGGHTIDGTPDGELRPLDTLNTVLWQLKTSSANKAHHVEIVRYSLHECIYSLGIMERDKLDAPPTRTLLCRYIKTKSDKVSLYLDEVERSYGDVEAARQYVIRMCDQMEDLTLGTRAEGWQAPPSCIDWTTGQRCGYFNHCHNGSDLTGPEFQTVADRYVKPEPGAAEAD